MGHNAWHDPSEDYPDLDLGEDLEEEWTDEEGEWSGLADIDWSSLGSPGTAGLGTPSGVGMSDLAGLADWQENWDGVAEAVGTQNIEEGLAAGWPVGPGASAGGVFAQNARMNALLYGDDPGQYGVGAPGASPAGMQGPGFKTLQSAAMGNLQQGQQRAWDRGRRDILGAQATSRAPVGATERQTTGALTQLGMEQSGIAAEQQLQAAQIEAGMRSELAQFDAGLNRDLAMARDQRVNELLAQGVDINIAQMQADNDYNKIKDQLLHEKWIELTSGARDRDIVMKQEEGWFDDTINISKTPPMVPGQFYRSDAPTGGGHDPTPAGEWNDGSADGDWTGHGPGGSNTPPIDALPGETYTEYIERNGAYAFFGSRDADGWPTWEGAPPKPTEGPGSAGYGNSGGAGDSSLPQRFKQGQGSGQSTGPHAGRMPPVGGKRQAVPPTDPFTKAGTATRTGVQRAESVLDNLNRAKRAWDLGMSAGTMAFGSEEEAESEVASLIRSEAEDLGTSALESAAEKFAEKTPIVGKAVKPAVQIAKAASTALDSDPGVNQAQATDYSLRKLGTEVGAGALATYATGAAAPWTQPLFAKGLNVVDEAIFGGAPRPRSIQPGATPGVRPGGRHDVGIGDSYYKAGKGSGDDAGSYKSSYRALGSSAGAGRSRRGESIDDYEFELVPTGEDLTDYTLIGKREPSEDDRMYWDMLNSQADISSQADAEGKGGIVQTILEQMEERQGPAEEELQQMATDESYNSQMAQMAKQYGREAELMQYQTEDEEHAQRQMREVQQAQVQDQAAAMAASRGPGPMDPAQLEQMYDLYRRLNLGR